MGRRQRPSPADDVVEGVSKLPWGIGIAMGVVFYLLFHWLAARPLPALTDPRQIGNAMVPMLVSQFSRWLQYLVPFLCLIGALVSFLKRRKRTTLAANVTSSGSARALEAMSWLEFETLVGEAFRLQGYQVKEQGGPQADGGIDLVLRKGSETFLVQCKQWKAFKVGVDVVRELYGVMAAQGAAGGFVVTSGRFTSDAVAFANGRNVRLVDGDKLFALLRQARAARGNPAASVRQQSPTAAPVADVAPVAPVAAPPCPKCSAPMVRRTARKGSQAGAEFWGCSTFPACRGTR